MRINQKEDIDLVIYKYKRSMFWQCPHCHIRITLSPANRNWSKQHVIDKARNHIKTFSDDPTTLFRFQLWHVAFTSGGRTLKRLEEIGSKQQRRVRLTKIYKFINDDRWQDKIDERLLWALDAFIYDYLNSRSARIKMVAYDLVIRDINELVFFNGQQQR